jgi:hypothetical protein
MDEDFDGFGGGAVAPPIPIPFTQADNLEVDRLTNGLARVRQQVAEGDLHPEEGDELQQRFATDLQPLLARKKQGEMEAMQQQQQLQAQHIGSMQAFGQASMEHGAQNIEKQIGHFVNRDGQSVYFKVQPDGSSDQIDFGDQPGADMGGDGDNSIIAKFLGSGEEGASEQPDTELTPDEPPPPAPSTPGPKGPGFTKEIIQNGPWTEIVTRDRNGNAVHSEYPNGKPPWADDGHQGPAMFGLDHRTLSRIDAIAQATTLHMRPGPHRDIAMARLKGQLIAGQIAENARHERISAIAAKQGANRQAAVDARYPPGTLRRTAFDAGINEAGVHSMLKDEEKDLSKSEEEVPTDFEFPKGSGKVYSPSAKGGKPALWKDMPREARAEEAERRIKDRLGRMGGKKGPTAPSGGAVAQQPAPQINPDVVKRINEQRKKLDLGQAYKAHADRGGPQGPMATTPLGPMRGVPLPDRSNNPFGY